MSLDSPLFASLNPAQRDAAMSVNENTIVLSCPGSGKTKTVEAKVVNILTNHPSAKVCCTTFSRDAANEMRERIYKALPNTMSKKERDSRLRIGTFHALCKRTIEAHKRKHIDIATPSEQKYHLKGAALELSLTTEPEDMDDYRSIIDSIPTMTIERKKTIDKTHIDLYNLTRKRINNAGKHTFNDLLVETVELFASGEIPPLDFTHLICDEAQDSDVLMYRFLQVHAHSGRYITLMLDDDQTLYSFRNSLGVNVCRWLHEETGARYIENATNYRSTEEILKPSKMLIDKNKDRIEKGIVSNRGAGGSFNYHTTFNQQATAELIKELTQENPGDFFIICRTNAEVQQICMMLLAAEIPFTSNQTSKITEHKTIALLFELLITLEDNTGMGVDLMFNTFIGKESDHEKTLAALGISSLLECLDIDLLSLEENIGQQGHLTKDQRTLLLDFLKLLKPWHSALADKRLNLAIRSTSQWILKHNKNDEDAPVLEMVVRFIQNARGKTISTRKIEIDNYFEEIKRKNNQNTEPKVSVMTAHSSKGLQRKSVIVWPVKEDSFPSAYRPDSFSSKEEHIEEERRVLYVAMTRAEDNLYLIHQQGRTNKTLSPTPFYPSRFLKDIGVLPQDYAIPGVDDNDSGESFETSEIQS